MRVIRPRRNGKSITLKLLQEKYMKMTDIDAVAQAENKAACPVCGCEEVDHRDLWTCRCPVAKPAQAGEHDELLEKR